MKGRPDAHSYSESLYSECNSSLADQGTLEIIQGLFFFFGKKNKIRKARTDGGGSGVVCRAAAELEVRKVRRPGSHPLTGRSSTSTVS